MRHVALSQSGTTCSGSEHAVTGQPTPLECHGALSKPQSFSLSHPTSTVSIIKFDKCRTDIKFPTRTRRQVDYCVRVSLVTFLSGIMSIRIRRRSNGKCHNYDNYNAVAHNPCHWLAHWNWYRKFQFSWEYFDNRESECGLIVPKTQMVFTFQKRNRNDEVVDNLRNLFSYTFPTRTNTKYAVCNLRIESNHHVASHVFFSLYHSQSQITQPGTIVFPNCNTY